MFILLSILIYRSATSLFGVTTDYNMIHISQSYIKLSNISNVAQQKFVLPIRGSESQVLLTSP